MRRFRRFLSLALLAAPCVASPQSELSQLLGRTAKATAKARSSRRRTDEVSIRPPGP